MSTAARLGYTEAIQFLEYVHPTLEWSTFLVKNTLGLTPGYAPIQALHGRHSISYAVTDLKALAYQYAQGKISHQLIQAREGEFMNKLEEKHLRTPEATAQTTDETAAQTTDETPPPSIYSRLGVAAYDVVMLARALFTIHLALATVGVHTERVGEELEALRSVTEEYYEKAYKIVGDLENIQEEMSDDEPHELTVSDDELESMMSALETVLKEG